MRPGLCSVTFRQVAAPDVVALAADAGLAAIEWGSDVHCPPGDRANARSLAIRCADVGIACPSYGTYFFAGQSAPEDLEPLCESAHALGATLLRIWTPFGVMPDAPADERARVAEAVARACDDAARADLDVALEFHPGTLTHTAASANALLEAVDRSDLRVYWQPAPGAPVADSLAELAAVRARLAHLHVFAWQSRTPDPPERLPLETQASLWEAALWSAATDARFPGRTAYLEFVRDDDPGNLAADAKALIAFIDAAHDAS